MKWTCFKDYCHEFLTRESWKKWITDKIRNGSFILGIKIYIFCLLLMTENGSRFFQLCQFDRRQWHHRSVTIQFIFIRQKISENQLQPLNLIPQEWLLPSIKLAFYSVISNKIQSFLEIKTVIYWLISSTGLFLIIFLGFVSLHGNTVKFQRQKIWI